MTSKKGQNWRIEAEIDRAREEGNWKRVIELADQLRTLCPGNECLSNFLGGEARLENFLEQTPPVDVNVAKAKSGLAEAKRYLLLAANEKDKQAPVALDAQLLLGKLHYAMGMYTESLTHYEEAELQSLTEKQLPNRSLRIVAESFAIKGLCLEKLPPTSKSKYKIAEWHSQMIKCFESAADITLVYLQEQDKVTSQQPNGTLPTNTGTIGSSSPQASSHSTKHMGPILETAILRAPQIHLQAGNIQASIDCYRKLLMALETSATQSLRLSLSRQLAEILLRGMRQINYTPPEPPASSVSTRKGTSATESPWKPKKYSGFNLFVPKNVYEEIILLLFISEAMAVRDAVLSISPEFKEARVRAFGNATAVYDLLTVVVVRWNQVELLNESFERAMKFSHKETYVWTQWALCLISLKKYIQAHGVLKRVIKLASQKVMPCLLATRLCYEHLNLIQQGIDWSQTALQRETANSQGLLSRCHLYIGLGYSILCSRATIKEDKKEYTSLVLEHYSKAQQADPNDHLAEYYLAYEYASNRQIAEAISHIKVALSLRAEHIPSLHLFTLLLTAQKQYKEAADLIKSIRLEYPDNFNILYVQANLELYIGQYDEALTTIKELFSLWRLLYEEETNVEVPEPQSEKRSESRSIYQMYSSEMSEKDSSSVHGQSLTASRVEQAFSEVASSMSTFVPKPGPQKAWLLQMQVWLLLAEVFLATNQDNEAVLAIQEASNIFPMSHLVMYTRGLLHEYKKEYEEAKQCYLNATAINPTHVKSLQHLGLVYMHLEMHQSAEKTLKDAARIDPLSFETWYNLGKVLMAKKEPSEASECFETALQIEASEPILPIYTLPITFE
ncbi:hypothetical protein QAD02_001396 [Eretmocerus hayati]|uniref:Uncharacterized protein n=1 Tax=Eretmocerus hayati TaxID=131215 RepID=A0ACC2NIR8_9HYME|nr:hypothetical protein QAD02_001396 [Eretmocerus hayati]